MFVVVSRVELCRVQLGTSAFQFSACAVHRALEVHTYVLAAVFAENAGHDVARVMGGVTI